MNSKIMNSCQLLADNRDIIKKRFYLEDNMMITAASMIFTEAGRQADADRMKACRKLLRERKGIFSNFRGVAEMVVISQMSLSENPEAYLNQLFSLYDQLHERKLFGTEYMVLSAISLSEQYPAGMEQEAVQKVQSLMRTMKELHPFLTSSEDMAYISLMALSPKTETELVEETEAAYQLLKERFAFHKDAALSLSMVLASLPGSASVKCARVQEIYDALKEQKISYGKDAELPSLGILSTLQVPAKQLVEEIKEAETYLHSRKGFGSWSIGKRARIMFASLITASVYQEDVTRASSSAVTASVSTMIAIQTALLVVMATNASATSAASSAAAHH